MHPEEPFTPEPSRRVAQPGNPGGAKSECCNPHPTRPGWGQIEVPQWGHFRVLQPAPSATRTASVPPISAAPDDMTCITCKTGNRHTLHHDQRESPAREPARQNRYTNPLHTASAGRSHTFAVGCLLRWYREDGDPQSRLHQLSTFMGHVDPESTAVYLTITADLLAEANRRFEAFAGPAWLEAAL